MATFIDFVKLTVSPCFQPIRVCWRIKESESLIVSSTAENDPKPKSLDTNTPKCQCQISTESSWPKFYFRFLQLPWNSKIFYLWTWARLLLSCYMQPPILITFRGKKKPISHLPNKLTFQLLFQIYWFTLMWPRTQEKYSIPCIPRNWTLNNLQGNNFFLVLLRLLFAAINLY